MAFLSRSFRNVRELEAAAASGPAHILEGASGHHVALIQQALIALDGALIAKIELTAQRFGPTTANAVLRYKQRRAIVNLSYQTQADAIVGVMTMASLDKGMARLERSVATEASVCKFDSKRLG